MPQDDASRRELAFHVAEIVVDVQQFLDAKNVGKAWEKLCDDVEYHWPHHTPKVKKMVARIEKKAARRPTSRGSRS